MTLSTLFVVLVLSSLVAFAAARLIWAVVEEERRVKRQAERSQTLEEAILEELSARPGLYSWELAPRVLHAVYASDRDIRTELARLRAEGKVRVGHGLRLYLVAGTERKT